MQAGGLRHRWTIEKPVAATNADTGEQTITWTAAATVWAYIRALSAKETLWAREVQSDVTHEARLRYRDDVLPAWRLTRTMPNGMVRVFYIEGVVDVGERYRELRVQCREAPDGQ